MLITPDYQPEVGDFVTHRASGINGRISDVARQMVTVTFPAEPQQHQRVVYDLSEIDEVFDPCFHQCPTCYYESILGRQCGLPCV